MSFYKNKRVVVTGVGSGIGKALAIQIAKQGGTPVLLELNEKLLEQTKSQIEALGVKTISYCCDVSNYDALQDVKESIIRHYQRIDGIINNAGLAISGTILEHSIEDYKKSMDVMFYGMVYGSKLFLPHFVEQNSGFIVNVSSIFGWMTVPGQSAYHTAKFAIRAFTNSLYWECKIQKLNIDVSCVFPGHIATNIVNSAKILSFDSKTSIFGNTKEMSDLGNQFKENALNSAQSAAKIILKGIHKKKQYIFVGLDAVIYQYIVRIFSRKYLYFLPIVGLPFKVFIMLKKLFEKKVMRR